MIAFEQRRLDIERNRQKEEDERVIKFKEVKFFLNNLKSNLENYGFVKIKEIIDSFLVENSSGFSQNSNVDSNKGELESLEQEKKDLENKMNIVLQKEQKITDQYSELKKKIEQEKDSGRKAEVRVFEINANQSEVRVKLNSILERERKVLVEEENYKTELQEAFALVGREAVQFQNLDFGNLE